MKNGAWLAVGITLAVACFLGGRASVPHAPIPASSRLGRITSISDTLDRPVWTNQLLLRMNWTTSPGGTPDVTKADSVRIIGLGLDDSALPRNRWADLALIRLHGEMGWSCSGCGFVLNDPYAQLAIQTDQAEYVAQARTSEGKLVAWMTVDTATRWSLHYALDPVFLRQADSASAAFWSGIKKSVTTHARSRDADTREPREHKSILRQTELMGQLDHFSSRMVDLDLLDYLHRLDTTSVDSVRLAALVSQAPTRRILSEELDVMGLATTVGLQSKSCYKQISHGDIRFRTRRSGSWRVTSAWNSAGKPVAWNAIDSGDGFQFPIWFHLDRDACLERADSAVSSIRSRNDLGGNPQITQITQRGKEGGFRRIPGHEDQGSDVRI